MDGIIGELSRRDKRKLERFIRSCKDGRLKTCYLIGQRHVFGIELNMEAFLGERI